MASPFWRSTLLCIFIIVFFRQSVPSTYAQADKSALPDLWHTRLQQAIEAYQQVLSELDPGLLSPTAPSYSPIYEKLSVLGQKLEVLSRIAAEALQASTPDWLHVERALEEFEAEYRELRCQSLPLRLRLFLRAHKVKKPAWGWAMSRSAAPLPRQLGAFDAEICRQLEFSMGPGAQEIRQIIVVPLTQELKSVKADVSLLKSPQGHISPVTISLLPFDYSRGAKPPQISALLLESTYEGTPDVPLGFSQAFVLVVTTSVFCPPGIYRGQIRIAPQGVKAQSIPVIITVHSRADESPDEANK